MGMSVIISVATEDDAEQILKLQYLGYQSEAELYGDWGIEPLTQTLGSLRAELSDRHVLVAKLGDEVVGTVRGRVEENGVARVARLVVHPRMQRHGLGGRLLDAVERQLLDRHDVRSFELSTGHRSLANLRLYARHGYRQREVTEVSRRLSVVALEKPVHSEYAATA